MTSLEIIDKLPNELAARLNADEFFCDIPVVVADLGDVEATMAQKQAMITEKKGKTGIGVVVLQLVADDDTPNLQFGPMTLKPAFQVVELVMENRGDNGTKKPARRVARRIVDVIKTFGLMGYIEAIKTGKPAIVPITNHSYGANVVMYQVEFECLEKPSVTPKQVAMPVISNMGQGTALFQIVCPTPGAKIFYTIDGTYPTPPTPDCPQGSLVYGVTPQPIPPQGVCVRACAYVNGMIASWVNAQFLTIN